MYNINRRKFLGLFGCGCCSLILPSCSSVPITDRKQLTIIPEYKINNQAANAYAKFKQKAKLITSGCFLASVSFISSLDKSPRKSNIKLENGFEGDLTICSGKQPAKIS